MAKYARGMIVGLAVMAASARAGSFVNFESGHVRPLAFVAGADFLLAVNTPASRLSVFRPGAGGLVPVAEVPVGLEPVAVAARLSPTGVVQAWVVNHLSDSVSVVEIDPADPESARVVRTLLVGDEPRDVVLAGGAGNRAFVSAAHRGQNRPGDSQPFTPDVGRADVWVFDGDALGEPLGGTPLAIVELFGDTPRGLARSIDGSTVWAAIFQSGNGTTALNVTTVRLNGGLPAPPPGAVGGAPATGLVVRRDPATGRWEDEIGHDWSSHVPFGFPDLDVFAIDANAAVPAVIGQVPHVGTTLFNLAVRPDNGKVYVSNTEARNEVRFEPEIRGHVTSSRITVLDGTAATAVDLNPHIDRGVSPGPPAEIEESLAFPTDMVFSPDGARLYVAALGSGQIGVFDTDLLEAGAALPRERLEVGGGPSGLALDPSRDRLYVMTRFDHRIVVVEPASQPTRAVVAAVPVGWDPTPPAVNAGRPLLYDARTTSAHGDAACASCHVFADADHLAWDLGDPFGSVRTITFPASVTPLGPGGSVTASFHPMKGPLLTQSLRGLAGTGPLHWRGDRTAAATGGDPFDSAGNLATFSVAFPGLLGSSAPPPAAEMDLFTTFVLSLGYPPNPFRPLDDVPTPLQATGEATFRTVRSDGAGSCETCHRLPAGTSGLLAVGFFEFPQIKVPHLRNAYTKVGRFGVAAPNDHGLPPYVAGDQVRAFGLEADGSLSSLVDFHRGIFFLTEPERLAVSEFVLAFDTGLKPAVGQQVTLPPENDPAVAARVALLAARDDAGDCDLVAHGVIDGDRRGWLRAGGRFVSDRQADGLVDEAFLRAAATAPGQEITFTCTPPGSGRWMGIDRDEDGVADGDERALGSDPGDALSLPLSLQRTPVPTMKLVLKDRTGPPPSPDSRKLKFVSSTKGFPDPARILPPLAGATGDPRLGGATLTVQGVATDDVVVVALPPAEWTALGDPLAPRGYKWKTTALDVPLKVIVVTADRIKVKGGRSAFAYTLNEPAQGAVAVRLRLGMGIEWCALAMPSADVPDKFVGLPGPAPATCAAP